MIFLNFFPLIFIFFASLFLFKKRSMRYLRYFQQEEYCSSRFLKWHWNNKAFDTKASIVSFLVFLSSFFGSSLVITLLGCFFLSLIPFFEENSLKDGKVRLKMTERATKIYETSIGFYLTVLAVTTIIFSSISTLPFFWLFQIALFQSIPLFLISAKVCLEPKEKRLQNSYLKEAKETLAKISPFVIGITGSYGKTSTKHALAHILQITLGPTFWPTKGVNTPMGITREIRNNLREGHRYAVIEMGAYQRGSIARLCDLTPPDAAIITAIGNTHLGRFGSQENILLGKSELAQAVSKDGILVCNGDDPGCRWIAEKYPKATTLFYGFDYHALDSKVLSWKITLDGTFFQVSWKGKTYEGLSPLLGKHSLSNVIASWTLACCLGSDPEFALAAIRSLSPVDNRLHVQRDGNITYLHDAYNSNPAGFSAALQVMSSLPSERRILMTPGMIELGELQKEENEKIGEQVSHVCDLTIVVGHLNRDSLIRGLKKGGFQDKQILTCETREDAFKQLEHVRREGDIILIENDLPDVYEQKIRF